MTRRALIGYTGFVGTTLRRSLACDALYNSANVEQIADERFDEVICAAAPATMWQANRDPAGDRANIRRLFDALARAEAGRVILISTIAVLADPAAANTESRAAFEAEKPYGRHRRELEELVTAHFPHAHVVRLPALFGPGLRKNFVFDLVNPVPSFLRPPAFATLAQVTGPELAGRHYRWDEALGMWALNRAALAASADRAALTAAVEDAGLAARTFTNSSSSFQYYNMDRLAGDLARITAAGLATVNISSAPLAAADLCRELTGHAFANPAPPVVHEDMRSDHAALWGGHDGYLYDRASVLADLKAFHAAATSPVAVGA